MAKNLFPAAMASTKASSSTIGDGLARCPRCGAASASEAALKRSKHRCAVVEAEDDLGEHQQQQVGYPLTSQSSFLC